MPSRHIEPVNLPHGLKVGNGGIDETKSSPVQQRPSHASSQVWDVFLTLNPSSHSTNSLQGLDLRNRSSSKRRTSSLCSLVDGKAEVSSGESGWYS